MMRCPICGCEYDGIPALSRVDNATDICPDCGTRQALEMLQVPACDVDHILDLVHEYDRRRRMHSQLRLVSVLKEN